MAAQLRQYGYEGQVVLAGAESDPPYQRPPISKAWLKGEADIETMLLRPKNFYDEQNIDLRTDATAVALDTLAKTVAFADGGVEFYDVLILALGSTARKLPVPGGDREDLIELRTLGDGDRLKGALGPGRRLAVVGAGYVGLEAAASARSHGTEVVVIERMDRVLQRVASEPLSAFFTDHHRSQGVEIRTGAEVTRFEDHGVRLADGELIVADAVLVGVGALACDALAREAGLDCAAGAAGGVIVDETARTSDPCIYAIGDMTVRPIPVMNGRVMRLESVPNALEQAKQAACAIMGRAAPPPEVPWFWSDQYSIKLQIAGLPDGAERQIVRGAPEKGQFAVFHITTGDDGGNRIVCVEAVNAPAEFMAGRQLIGKAAPVDLDKLGDASLSMKDVAVAQR